MKPRTSQKAHQRSTGSAQHQQEVAGEQIQQRAYELYINRGQEPGHELDDWLEAEREIKGSHQQQYAG